MYSLGYANIFGSYCSCSFDFSCRETVFGWLEHVWTCTATLYIGIVCTTAVPSCEVRRSPALRFGWRVKRIRRGFL